MSLFKWHRHQWWLTNTVEYGDKEHPGRFVSFTMLTYVCRVDRSHTKQVRLQGQQTVTAEIILQRQRDDQELDAVPDVFQQAWGKRGNA